MKRPVAWLFGLLIPALILVLLIRGQYLGKKNAVAAGHVPSPGNNPLPSHRDDSFSSVSQQEILGKELEHFRNQLLDNPGSAPEVLAALRSALFRGDQVASARAVSAFLRTGRDAPTGMGFAVGPDGVLAASPTLRAALLNWHPTLDPLVALEMAREILKTTDSADEYAVAMRNLAWNDLDGDLKPELSAAFHNLLARRDWQASPTAGYLESFDVAVELGDAATFQRLADFAVPDAHAESVVRAACMSMDRMILRDPGHLTTAWNSSPQWMDKAPLQRASLLSRLDITREDHRALLVDYLSSKRMTAEERDYFEALYPNGNHLHGHRLVTTTEKSPTIEERAAMDRRILGEIDRLLPGAAPAAAASLQKIRGRLSGFVNE